MKNKINVEERAIMAKINTFTIRDHFEHPDSPLKKLSEDREYICGGCDTAGNGTRYRCAACNFDFHEYCSYCPNNLSSFMHPHDLLLVTSDHLETRRTCNICLEPLTGFHYMCNLCDNFDVHPLCTQLPEDIHHVIDVSHPLKLRQLMSPGSCIVCKTECSLWCYGCDICGVNIHFQCLFEPYGPANANYGQEPQPPPPPPIPNQPIPIPPPYGYNGYEYPNYGYGVPYYEDPHGYGYGYGSVGPSYYYANHQQGEAGRSTSSSSRGISTKSMFSLVGNLTTALLSDFVLGSLGFSSF